MAQRTRLRECPLALEDVFQAEHELDVYEAVLGVRVASSSDDRYQSETSIQTPVYVNQLSSHCVLAKWELGLASGSVIQLEEHTKERSDELDERKGLQLD